MDKECDRTEERINFAHLGACFLYDTLRQIKDRLDQVLTMKCEHCGGCECCCCDKEAQKKLDDTVGKFNTKEDAVGAALAAAEKPLGS